MGSVNPQQRDNARPLSDLRRNLAMEGMMMHIIDRHQVGSITMSDTGIAKIFMHGRSQAVRLPLAFRLPGEQVRVRRVASGILLEPIITDIDAWFAEMDRITDAPFMPDGRNQPPMPKPEDLFE